MRKSHAKWIEFLFGPLLWVIGFFYRSYIANRARVAALKTNAKVAGLLKVITVLVLAGWILTWFFASEESRTRLVDEVKQSIGGFEVKPEQPQSGTQQD